MTTQDTTRAALAAALDEWRAAGADDADLGRILGPDWLCGSGGCYINTRTGAWFAAEFAGIRGQFGGESESRNLRHWPDLLSALLVLAAAGVPVREGPAALPTTADDDVEPEGYEVPRCGRCGAYLNVASLCPHGCPPPVAAPGEGDPFDATLASALSDLAARGVDVPALLAAAEANIERYTAHPCDDPGPRPPDEVAAPGGGEGADACTIRETCLFGPGCDGLRCGRDADGRQPVRCVGTDACQSCAALRAAHAQLLADLGALAPAGEGQDEAARLDALGQAGEGAAPGVAAIDAERARQISVEGWTAAHDDAHAYGALAKAAACYAVHHTDARVMEEGRDAWPWFPEWDKRDKHTVLRRLAIAGALCAAEYDRLTRIEQRAASSAQVAAPPECGAGPDEHCGPECSGYGTDECAEPSPAPACPECARLRERVAEVESRCARLAAVARAGDALARADVNGPSLGQYEAWDAASAALQPGDVPEAAAPGDLAGPGGEPAEHIRNANLMDAADGEPTP